MGATVCEQPHLRPMQLTCTCARLLDGDPLSLGPSQKATVQLTAGQDHHTLLTVSAAAGGPLLSAPISSIQAWQAAPGTLFIRSTNQGQDTCICIHSRDQQALQQLFQLIQQQVAPASNTKQQDVQNPSAAQGDDSSINIFEQKTDKGSADQYFAYYGMLQHQQNMLQDYVRTGMYQTAITQNPADFQGKVVMDVGAGSGILSLFAAQAGARKVYAVEASNMAHFARQLAHGNPALGRVIQVLHSKVEELQLPEKVDVLVSEPMGTLLVNERMLETYIYARDHFLKPGGKMFPQVGRIHVAAFSDEVLHAEVAAKAAFWTQTNFHGIDVSPLYTPAMAGYFAQVVVDAMDPGVLVSTCSSHTLDLSTCTEAQLHDITIPLQLQVATLGPCVVHGLATWFDVLFPGSASCLWLSTAPGMPTTHWFQLRCLLMNPICVPGPCMLTGQLRLVAHRRQSYDVHVTLHGPPAVPGGPVQTSTGKFDLKEPYYRQLTVGWWQGATVQPQPPQQMAGQQQVQGGMLQQVQTVQPQH